MRPPAGLSGSNSKFADIEPAKEGTYIVNRTICHTAVNHAACTSTYLDKFAPEV